MKKIVKLFLSAALIVAATALTSCKPGETEGPSNGFAGEYLTSGTPFYSDMNAVNPDDVALTIQLEQELQLTFANLIMFGNAYLISVELDPMTMAFNADGNFTVTATSEDEQYPLFPNVEAGLQPSYLTYSLNGDSFVLNVSSEMIESILGATDTAPESIEQIKALLATFTKGVIVYDSQTNSAKINLKHKTVNDKLYIYIDKALLVDTWDCVEPVALQIIELMEQGNPATAQMIKSIVVQIDPMLEGFTSIEVGIALTKQ